ncbi:MAG: YebC/PmpR family DNA-binding transcriptional regulator [Limnothrix sp. BL-A-16]|jgi:YebC/PmpR family DNA-binding regulatory protein
MAGHSKWANIKRQKARVDAVRGSVFTKLSREIIVAARSGADPTGNFQLRTAIDKAKAAGVPNANIDRAIAKGAGRLAGEGAELEAIRYEGYGPGGVAVLIEALTDNRNRTAADLRVAFSKNGGNLGETGCVGWMFENKGVVTIVGEAIEEDALLEASIEGEGESYDPFSGQDQKGFDLVGFEVKTAPDNLENLESVLKARGFRVWQSETRWFPTNTVAVTDHDQAKALIKMMDTIEDLDDVQSVATNFEMTDDLMAEVMA